MWQLLRRLKFSLVAVSATLLAIPISGATAYAASCISPALDSATVYQSFVRQEFDGKWYRGDYGQSVKLPNGKTLFVFGDTIIGKRGAARASSAVHNSALLISSTGTCGRMLTGPQNSKGAPTDWVRVPATLDVSDRTDYYWASTPFVDGKILRMFVLHMYNDANGFHTIGSDIATFKLDTATPQLISVMSTPSSRANSGPVWGAAVVSDASYTYVYGSKNAQKHLTFGHYYYVARIPKNTSILTASNWRYWNGTTWVSDKTAAKSIISGVDGPGTNASVFKRGGSYIMVSKVNDVLGSRLNYWKASSPAGPWKPGPNPLLTALPGTSAAHKEHTYLGLAHPQLYTKSGKLLVSWSRNSSDPSYFGNPRYGVLFAEVTIP